MVAAPSDPNDEHYSWEEAPSGAGSRRLALVVAGVLVAVGLASLLALFLRPGEPATSEPAPREEVSQDSPEAVPLAPAETREEEQPTVAPAPSSPETSDAALFGRFAAALPADGQMYFDVKLRDARRAPVWKALAEKIPGETLAEIRERIGDIARTQVGDLDALSRRAAGVPEELLDNVTRVTGAVAGESDYFIVGIQTGDAIDWGEAVEMMRKLSSGEATEIHDINVSGLTGWVTGDDSGPDRGAPAVVRYRDDFALVGKVSVIEETLAAMTGEEEEDAESFAARARAAEPYSALVVTHVTSPVDELTLPQTTDGEAMNPLLATPLPVSSLEGGQVALVFSDTIILTSANAFGDGEQAIQFKGMLDGMLALVSMMTAQHPDLAQMMAGIRTGMEGDTITVRLEITPDQIAAICQLVLAEVPSAKPARGDDAATCRSNLRAIYAALVMHTMEHDGAYPASLADLADSLPDPECLWSPLAGPGDESRATSYVLRAELRGAALAAKADPAHEPIVWLDPGLAGGAPITVLYGDGHVQRVPLPLGDDAVSTFRAASVQAPASRPSD